MKDKTCKYIHNRKSPDLLWTEHLLWAAHFSLLDWDVTTTIITITSIIIILLISSSPSSSTSTSKSASISSSSNLEWFLGVFSTRQVSLQRTVNIIISIIISISIINTLTMTITITITIIVANLEWFQDKSQEVQVPLWVAALFAGQSVEDEHQSAPLDLCPEILFVRKKVKCSVNIVHLL